MSGGKSGIRTSHIDFLEGTISYISITYQFQFIPKVTTKPPYLRQNKDKLVCLFRS